MITGASTSEKPWQLGSQEIGAFVAQASTSHMQQGHQEQGKCMQALHLQLMLLSQLQLPGELPHCQDICEGAAVQALWSDPQTSNLHPSSLFTACSGSWSPVAKVMDNT